MGIVYTLCLSNPDKLHELVDNYLSQKILSVEELENLFLLYGRNIPIDLKVAIKYNPKLYPEAYDEFIFELLSDARIELGKSGGILYQINQIDKRLGHICPFGGDMVKELELSIKGVSEEFNFSIFDTTNLNIDTHLINSLRDKNIFIKLLSVCLDKKKYKFWDVINKQKAFDIDIVEKIQKDEYWDIWLKYLETFIIAKKNNMYIGMYWV